MTTTTAGGKITGLLALTCLTDVALAVGDFVHLVGNYKVALADGTKPVLGHVSVRNVKRTSSPTSTSYPVAATPGGQVTVETPGFYVKTHVAGAGGVTAGTDVGIGAAGALLTAGAGVRTIGVALTTGAAGAAVDVLVSRN